MRKTVVITLLIIACYSCGGDRRPADVLPPAQMRAVMWDLIRAGEFLEAFVIYKDTSADNTSPGVAWYHQVYKMHGITEAQFRKSYAYYKAHPQLMKDMLDSLTKMKPMERKDTAHARVDSAARLDSLRKDSINRDSVKKDSAVVAPVPAPEESIKPPTPNIRDKKMSTMSPLQRRKFIDSVKRKRKLMPAGPLPQ